MRRPLNDKRIPVIGQATPSTDALRGNNLANEFSSRVVTLDILYFTPTPDADKPLKISDILSGNDKAMKELVEIMRATGRELDADAAANEMIKILDAVVLNQKGWFTGVQRFVHQLYDIAEVDDSTMRDATARINSVVTEFHRDVRDGRDPKYYNVLLDKVVEGLFGINGTKIAPNTIHVDFIAAHGTGRDPFRMIREIPLPSTRLMLLDWMHNNIGPMAIVRVGHAPRLFDDMTDKKRMHAGTRLVQ